MRSLDSVLFYVNSQVILKKLPQAFQAFLGMPLDDQQFEETIVNIPETSSVLNVILQAIYRLSCTKHSPTFDHLLLAVRRMPLYGLQPKNYIFDSESSSSSLFDMLLSHAPLCPIQVYTLAAQFNIDELAVKCSSHLLSYRLSELTDELVTTMGAVYLRRLMVLHTSLIDTLKRVLLQPPPPHSAIQNCGFEDQKKLSRAWALTSSYLAWDSRPDLPIHQLQNTFLALGDHLQCEKCKEVLKLRVKEVVVRWVNVKMFELSDLPDGIILLITDTLAAPGDFILHRTLATHLKRHKSPRSLVLSVSEGIARWIALASKSNVSLQHHITTGALEFVDVLAFAQPPFITPEDDSSNGSGSLRDVIYRVQTYLDHTTNHEPPLIILDDITMLEWIGFPLLDVVRFFRALRSACLKANATLFVRHHTVTPNEPDELFRHLLQICNYHLEVSPLSSGKSGTISGEISLHPGFSAPLHPITYVSRSMATQYRLTDVGPVYFAKGTSGSVL
ncbi:hypothetical protein HYPSUDRAFT_186727 [Hypholoma sublateritium FD-334 SS-4]|uniref:BTB domain-containing protein n=1 Tax=Hypholoma sublateritium (strain FD-334 SS-4) TaxID=945553 RepID=A0A0D2NT24_HYPSF|nr:hypothetical protein HYPSUDRAFT_186727 [Hypholoma sublateritium FD-334 SS-4]